VRFFGFKRSSTGLAKGYGAGKTCAPLVERVLCGHSQCETEEGTGWQDREQETAVYEDQPA
jgi:hypothetical protein